MFSRVKLRYSERSEIPVLLLLKRCAHTFRAKICAVWLKTHFSESNFLLWQLKFGGDFTVRLRLAVYQIG